MKKNTVFWVCILAILRGVHFFSSCVYAQQESTYIPNIWDSRTLGRAEKHIRILADAGEKETLVAIMTTIKTKLGILTDGKSQYILFELGRLIETHLPTAIQKHSIQENFTGSSIIQTGSDVTTPNTQNEEAKIEHPDDDSEQEAKQGKASYYASSLEGNHTANGDIFDNNAFTAAHKTLPFNTRIKVTNSKNNLRVVVRINDRGPFTPGRILDLSQAAFKAINNDSLRAGVLDVTRELVE